MQRDPRTSVDSSSTEDSSGTNSGCNYDSSDAETQQLLENLSRGQPLAFSCTNSHPLFNQRQRNTQLPKKSIIRLGLSLVFLSLIVPFYLLKKACSISSRESWSQKIVSWATLFLLVFGATYLGLFDGSTLQHFGDEWSDFSLCDCIQGETEDLRSLIKANHILERKAHEITALKEELGKLRFQLHVLSSDLKNVTRRAVSEVLASYTSKGITTWSIRKILKQIMDKLDEDDVQMPDYALKSAGASLVHSRTTRSYRHEGGNYFWRSFIILPFVKSPEVILQPNRSPGMCWSFPGDQGEAVVKLAAGILPTAITIDHIAKKVSPTGEISSAPKDFTIYGLKEENEDGIFLGQFVYNAEGDVVQTFKLKVKPYESISYVKLKVLSNWGHPNYTCIYRFRVHDMEKI